MAEQVQQRPRLRFWVLAVAVLALAGAAVAHQVHFWHWYIEDAAISFSYARNWAEGHGLVATPDTERLEGYSNFTWVALLALGQLLGFDSFQSSKWLQVALGFLTVPLTALLAREASPDRTDGTPVLAAGYLATASTFAVWGACGLENSLFSAVMAAALLGTAVELRTEARVPWSALLWFLLAISRPEAVLYCAIAGFLTMLFTLRRGIRPTLLWLLLFFVPFGAYHAIRFQYFAYEFPQTYYGKMTTKEPAPLAWNRRGWKQVRGWAHTLWTGYYLPLWFFGLVGWRGAKGGITAVLLVLAGLCLLLPELIPTEPLVVGAYEIAPLLLPQDFPDGWYEGRSYLMVFCALFLPLLALGRGPGWPQWAVAIGLTGIAGVCTGLVFVGNGTWIVLTVLPAAGLAIWRLFPALREGPPAHVQVRVVCWGVTAGVLFFAVYTQGDWMKAWRWMSLLQVPLAVAFATGVRELADAADTAVERVRGAVPAIFVSTAVWSVLLLIAVAATVGTGSRFAYGPWWGLAIAGGAVLLALPLGLARDHLGTSWGITGWSFAAAVTALTAFPNLDFTRSLGSRPETGPFSVKQRVEFVETVRDRLGLEHPIVDLDVDMGAHLWWGRDNFKMLDLAGLVDIPFAQHRFKRPFVKEYVYDEMRPHFAHVHGGWATNSRIKTFPEWRRQYVEIPGFPAGAVNIHIGNFVRRDLFLTPIEAFEGYPDTPPIELEDGVVFHGHRIPSEPGANRTLWLEVAVRDTLRRAVGAELKLLVLAAVDGELKQTWSVPLGYDWLLFDDWRADEVFVGGFDLPTRGLEPGTYDLGFVFYTDQRPLKPLEAPLEAAAAPPVFAPGEIWRPGALTIVSAEQVEVLALEDVQATLRLADPPELDCEAAAHHWFLAQRHLPANEVFAAEHRPKVRASLAACWAQRASAAPEPTQALINARTWNHLDPLYRSLRGPAAERWIQRGHDAAAEDDWQGAYDAWSTALKIDPTRSWARRWAEQARDRRLELGGFDGGTTDR